MSEVSGFGQPVRKMVARRLRGGGVTKKTATQLAVGGARHGAQHFANQSGHIVNLRPQRGQFRLKLGNTFIAHVIMSPVKLVFIGDVAGRAASTARPAPDANPSHPETETVSKSGATQ